MLVTALLSGRLIAAAFACGFNLYATVALIGIVARLGLWPDLPPGLHGLGNGIVIASALLLFFVESAVDKTRFVDNAWDAGHSIIRPLAAGLLAWLAIAPAGTTIALFAALAAALAALAAHATKSGIRIAIGRRPGRWRIILMSLAEDVAAIGLTTAALLAARVASFAALALILLLAVVGPGYWRAAAFGARAAAARVRGFFTDADWREAGQLPASLGGLARTDPMGLSPTPVTRAAALGLTGAGAYRNGWLVFERDGTAFLFRSRLRARRVDIPALTSADLAPTPLADEVSAISGNVRFQLFLLRDGPAPEAVLNELIAPHRNAKRT